MRVGRALCLLALFLPAAVLAQDESDPAHHGPTAICELRLFGVGLICEGDSVSLSHVHTRLFGEHVLLATLIGGDSHVR